jgi:signal-transduction protein with cAMP-binding, CBS, and nucleotidyltransferase domain
MKEFTLNNSPGNTSIMIDGKDFGTKSFLSMPISSLLQSNIAILDRYKTAADAINAMKQHSTRSVLVSDLKKEIIGLVSKTDILYKAVSLHKQPPSQVVLEDIMSAPIISIRPEMTIVDALSVLEKHVIRQVVVSSGSEVYGIISRDDIMMKMERALVETFNAFKMDSPVCVMSPFASTDASEHDSSLTCPHCQIEYRSKDLLLEHVKITHAESRHNK